MPYGTKDLWEGGNKSGLEHGTTEPSETTETERRRGSNGQFRFVAFVAFRVSVILPSHPPLPTEKQKHGEGHGEHKH
jgi:hypothetical protein